MHSIDEQRDEQRLRRRQIAGVATGSVGAALTMAGVSLGSVAATRVGLVVFGCALLLVVATGIVAWRRHG